MLSSATTTSCRSPSTSTLPGTGRGHPGSRSGPASASAWLIPAKQSSGIQIALVVFAAGLLAAAGLSLAIVLSADLRARAHASAAQYQAVGQVTAAYEAAQVSEIAQSTNPASQAISSTTLSGLLSSDLSVSLLAVAASGRKVRARIKQTDELLYITGIRYEGGNLKVSMSAEPTSNNNSWHDLADIDEFDSTS